MLNVILVYIILSGLFGSGAGIRMMRSLFDVIILFFVIGFVIRVGLSLLPLILIGVICCRVVLPFMQGFLSSFRKD